METASATMRTRPDLLVESPKFALASSPVTDYRLLFDWQTKKLEAKTPFPLVAHHRRRPYRRVHLRKRKLDADGLADEEL